MSLALDGHAHAVGVTASSNSASLTTTNSNVVVIALIVSNGNPVTGVSSPTLGAFTYRGANATRDEEEWYAIASNPLTNELITAVQTSSAFIALDVFGISGANTSSPFDGAIVTGSSDPLSISTAAADTFIFGGFRFGDANPTSGAGWTQISGADYQLAEYQIVSSPQTGLSVTVGVDHGTADGAVADAVIAAAAILPAALPLRSSCPSQDDLRTAFLAMLPRGRAWGEGGPGREHGGVIYMFWDAIASVFAWVHAQLCALLLEFICKTATLTLDLWNKEYGLPDGCDAYPNVCAKVAAFGGTQCAYYVQCAANIGWVIACGTNCAFDSGTIEAGMPIGLTYGPAYLFVIVYTALSPAYDGLQLFGPAIGFYEAGMDASCPGDLTALDCMLQRIVHAEVTIIYSIQ